MAQPLRQIQGASAERRRGARRRFKYWRRHTPHFFLATAAIASAAVLCVVEGVAFVAGGVTLTEAAFAVTCVTTGIVFAAYFWGFFMVMSGNIPVDRIKVFLPHAIVGTLSPLVYMLNLSLLFDSITATRLPGSSLALSIVSLGLLAIQFFMGKRVVRVERPRLLKLHGR